MLFWTVTLFLLAALHLFTPWVLRAIAAVVLACGFLILARSRAPASLPLTFTGWWPQALPLASVAFVMAALFMMGMRPGVAWDAGTYHLTVPRLYLEHGGFRPIQFNVYSNWPLNIELLFGLALALHDYFLATLVQWIFAGFVCWALILGGQVHGHRVAGPVAACLFLANEVVLYEAGVAYVDLGLSFFFLMALLYALHAEQTPGERTRALVLSGICCGLMAGVKLIGIFGVACIGAIVLWSTVRARGLSAGVKDTARWFLAPSAIVALPWYIKAAWYTGNPVYPFFYEVLRGAEWSAPLAEQFQRWQSSLGMGRSLTDYLLLPFRLALQAGEGYHRFDGRIAPTWLSCVPLIVIAGRRSVTIRRAGTVALLYFICWALSSQQARFIIPALSVLALATALAVDTLIASPAAGRARSALRLGAGAAASVLLLTIARETTDTAGRWWYRWQLRDLDVVLEAGVPPVFRFINANLPRAAKLLFLDVNQGFFCERDYVADSFFEASQVNAFLLRNRRADEIQETLLGQGFTHVLVGVNKWGIPYPPSLGEFLAERARLVHTSPQNDQVYEIRPSF